MHETILKFKARRYGWWALVLLVFSMLIYLSQGSAEPPNGGTWQGYTLGGLAAALVVWLTALGIRKRRYASRWGSLQGWVSAHVYLGTVLLIVATLHSGFQFGMNIHSITYALLFIVIFSGFFGLYVYLHYPGLSARNRAGLTYDAMQAELQQLDNRLQQMSQSCQANIQATIESSIEQTMLGGNVLTLLSGWDNSKVMIYLTAHDRTEKTRLFANRNQQTVIQFLAKCVPASGIEQETQRYLEILSVLARRQAILKKLRTEIRLQAWLEIWLYIHVPLSLALLGALLAHIFSVFVYW